MDRQRSLVMDVGIVLMLAGLFFAGLFGSAWPFVVAAGAGLIILRTAALLFR